MSPAVGPPPGPIFVSSQAMYKDSTPPHLVTTDQDQKLVSPISNDAGLNHGNLEDNGGDPDLQTIRPAIDEALRDLAVERKMFEIKIKMIEALESNLNNYISILDSEIGTSSNAQGIDFQKMSKFALIQKHFDNLNLFLSEKIYFNFLCRQLRTISRSDRIQDLKLSFKRKVKHFELTNLEGNGVDSDTSGLLHRSHSEQGIPLACLKAKRIYEIKKILQSSISKSLKKWSSHSILSMVREETLLKKIRGQQILIERSSQLPFGNMASNHFGNRVANFPGINSECLLIGQGKMSLSVGKERLLHKRSGNGFKRISQPGSCIKKISTESRVQIVPIHDVRDHLSEIDRDLKSNLPVFQTPKKEPLVKARKFESKSEAQVNSTKPAIHQNQNEITQPTSILCSMCRSKIVAGESPKKSAITKLPQSFSSLRRVFLPNSESKEAYFLEKFNASLQRDVVHGFDLEAEAGQSGFKSGLEELIVRVMFNLPINHTHLGRLSATGKVLFSIFLLKKRLIPREGLDLMSLPSHSFTQTEQTKRVEENLKLVFKRALRYLRAIFMKSGGQDLSKLLRSDLRIYSNWHDYCFFGFYFQEPAIRMDMPIEKFFEPGTAHRKYKRLSKHMNLVPKTISKVFIHSVKKSRLFIEHLEFFTEKVLIRECAKSIRKKARTLARDWNRLVADSGLVKTLRILRNGFLMSERCKLAWSIQDVKLAVVSAQKYLDEQ